MYQLGKMWKSKYEHPMIGKRPQCCTSNSMYITNQVVGFEEDKLVQEVIICNLLRSSFIKILPRNQYMHLNNKCYEVTLMVKFC